MIKKHDNPNALVKFSLMIWASLLKEEAVIGEGRKKSNV